MILVVTVTGFGVVSMYIRGLCQILERLGPKRIETALGKRHSNSLLPHIFLNGHFWFVSFPSLNSPLFKMWGKCFEFVCPWHPLFIATWQLLTYVSKIAWLHPIVHCLVDRNILLCAKLKTETHITGHMQWCNLTCFFQPKQPWVGWNKHTTQLYLEDQSMTCNWLNDHGNGKSQDHTPSNPPSQLWKKSLFSLPLTPSKWPFLGLSMGVILTTYKSWDDPPSIQYTLENYWLEPEHTLLKRYIWTIHLDLLWVDPT